METTSDQNEPATSAPPPPVPPIFKKESPPYIKEFEELSPGDSPDEESEASPPLLPKRVREMKTTALVSCLAHSSQQASAIMESENENSKIAGTGTGAGGT